MKRRKYAEKQIVTDTQDTIQEDANADNILVHSDLDEDNDICNQGSLQGKKNQEKQKRRG
jgi:hypothetical protein